MPPQIFIGSSTEGIQIAHAIQLGLDYYAICNVWDKAFTLSRSTIDELIANAAANDFAIFVFSPDDVSEIRKKTLNVARDNVLFEAGLFIGVHGKENVFIVHPRDADIHIPSDLLGYTCATYDSENVAININAALGPVVTQIKQAIEKSNRTSPQINIIARTSTKDDAYWPLKLNITIKNICGNPLIIESGVFVYTDTKNRAPNAKLTDGSYVPKFLIGRDNDAKDIYEDHCVLPPGRELHTWVPFDPVLGQKTLEQLSSEQKTGTWSFRTIELGKLRLPSVKNCRRQF